MDVFEGQWTVKENSRYYHNVGVSTVASYEVKKINLDYFLEEQAKYDISNVFCISHKKRCRGR